jgi:hypothetical protein
MSSRSADPVPIAVGTSFRARGASATGGQSAGGLIAATPWSHGCPCLCGMKSASARVPEASVLVILAAVVAAVACYAQDVRVPASGDTLRRPV